MKLATDMKTFFSDWRNLLALGTLGAIGAWVYSRVWMVNPAILGDEYLYSISARKVGPWDAPPVADFSNYLFNFVYQATNLCGPGFYQCAKVLNLGFFLGFVLIIFIVAMRFLPFWGAYGFMIATGLSPLSVYTSMFLPESMYFFFIGLVLLAALRAIQDFRVQTWALVGIAVGLASLVKPHAWLSAIAIGITLLVVGLGNRDVGFKKTLLSALSLAGAAAAGRLAVGLLIAGPKALGFFGVYFGANVIEEVVSGPADPALPAEGGSSPMAGVIALFAGQLNTHLLSVTALMSLAMIGLVVALIDILRTRELRPATGFGLFAFIWLVSMMIEIVMFTGWITGSGDDHTTRVLLRYYDFLFVIVPLAGISVLASQLQEKLNVFVRWGLAVAFGALLTPAFSGFFGTLTIQIADAPNLAGLVVNSDVFNAAALVGIAGVILFATFPKLTPYAFLAILPVTLIGTGWQIQDQYQGFRGELSASDKAGQYINANFSEDEIDRALILATSRFDATNVAIWADSSKISYEMYGPGSQFDSEMAPENTSFIVTSGDLGVVGEFVSSIPGDGYTIYLLE